MSFKEKHQLETLPAAMEKLSSEIAALHRVLEDPGLFARDQKAFAEKSERLAAVQSELARAEDSWLELEALREELES